MRTRPNAADRFELVFLQNPQGSHRRLEREIVNFVEEDKWQPSGNMRAHPTQNPEFDEVEKDGAYPRVQLQLSPTQLCPARNVSLPEQPAALAAL